MKYILLVAVLGVGSFGGVTQAEQTVAGEASARGPNTVY